MDLKQIRKKYKMTQKELSNIRGLSVYSISKYENGRHMNKHIENIIHKAINQLETKPEKDKKIIKNIVARKVVTANKTDFDINRLLDGWNSLDWDILDREPDTQLPNTPIRTSKDGFSFEMPVVDGVSFIDVKEKWQQIMNEWNMAGKQPNPYKMVKELEDWVTSIKPTTKGNSDVREVLRANKDTIKADVDIVTEYYTGFMRKGFDQDLALILTDMALRNLYN